MIGAHDCIGVEEDSVMRNQRVNAAQLVASVAMLLVLIITTAAALGAAGQQTAAPGQQGAAPGQQNASLLLGDGGPHQLRIQIEDEPAARADGVLAVIGRYRLSDQGRPAQRAEPDGGRR